MNIGIICYPSVGGSGILATALGEELAVRGHNVHFISYERPFRLPANARRMFFHPVAINGYDLFKYPDYTLPLSVKMAEVSRAHRLDILHVHYAVPHATAAILAQAMLPKRLQPRLVTTLHGTDSTLLGRDPGYAPAIHHALTHSDAVTAVSNFLKKETRQTIGFKGRIHVIHNFFKPRKPGRSRAEVQRELGLDNEVLLFHASNLRPLKRIDLLLESVARIRSRRSFKLLLLAGGDFAPFAKLARSLKIQDRIIVREDVAEVEDYLQCADVGLFTSEVESFCLSILEGMFFGCPSVARRVGGIPEFVTDGVTGRLVDSAGPKTIAAAVSELIDNADYRSKLGEASRLVAQHHFSAAAIVDKYESLYRRVLTNLKKPVP